LDTSILGILIFDTLSFIMAGGSIVMNIENKHQIPGFCKKIAKKDLYRYPWTPAMAYRLIRAGVLTWAEVPDLHAMWEKQLEAIKNEVVGTSEKSD